MIAPRGAKINTRSKEAGYKVFVTKLAAEMFRRGFKKLPKMLPRSFQDAPKVVMVVVVVVVVVMMMIRLESWLDPDDDGYDAIRMIFKRTNCLGSTRRYHFFCR